MEFFGLLMFILFIWFIARVLGAIFRGPRWRRRQTRKNYDYAAWLASEEAMRRARRDRW